MSFDFNEPTTNKSLGQHWLNDEQVLLDIATEAALSDSDTVLEIGSGPGALTRILVEQVSKVVAVEFDDALARDLPKRVPDSNLQIVHEDILKYDFSELPEGYKVVANIPYYLTSHLLQRLSESGNPPSVAVLLMQKEVAERAAAKPGDMSLLSVTAQFYWQVSLGVIVKAELFTPPPKVDSQVLILNRREDIPKVDVRDFFRLVKAGFSQKRKMLSSSLSGGLRISKQTAAELLTRANIDPTRRAQTLSLEEWLTLYKAL